MAEKAKRKPKKAKEPKAKQGYLDPEMAPMSIPEIEDAAEAYCAARDSRTEELTSEIALKKALGELMKSNNLTTYEYDGKIVTLDGDPQVKVKKKKKEGSEE